MFAVRLRATSKMQRVAATMVAAILVVLPAAILSAPRALLAQDDEGFSFDEEDVAPIGDPVEFDFDDVEPVGDADPVDDEPTAQPVPEAMQITGIIIPSDALPPAQADQLTAALMEQLGDVPGFEVVPNDGLRDEFQIMGAELAFECAFDPVCLGRYGRQLGLDQVVVGRVEQEEAGTWATTLDLFDAESSSVADYRYYETEDNLAAVSAALRPQIRALFGLRQERNLDTGRSEASGTIQKIFAWSTLGLSVAALSTGIVMGLQAKSANDDLNAVPVIEDEEGNLVYDITQREASGTIDDAESSALLANILLGSGLALGVVSAVLFAVTPGQDIDEDEDVASRRMPRFAPYATAEGGFGVTGGLRF